jgi:hypothetical protein
MKEITPEEKDSIINALDSIRKQMSGQDLSDYISKDNTKLIECKHEIVISVVASIFEEDDTGNLIGAKEISKKNYHIPVPSNKRYEDYLHGFFNFLENCMSSSLEKAEEQEETKNG